MKYTIEIVSPDKVRNDQAGDWRFNEDGSIEVLVAEMPVDSALVVGIHELIEARLCQRDNVTDQEVTRFDAQFESERITGKHALSDEAGDDNRAPYQGQHQAATFAERACCAALRIEWRRHEKNVLRSLA